MLAASEVLEQLMRCPLVQQLLLLHYHCSAHQLAANPKVAVSFSRASLWNAGMTQMERVALVLTISCQHGQQLIVCKGILDLACAAHGLLLSASIE